MPSWFAPASPPPLVCMLACSHDVLVRLVSWRCRRTCEIYVLSSLMRAPLTRRPRLRWLQVEHLASKGLPLHTLAGLQRPIPKPQLSNPNPHPEPHVPEQRIGGSRERWEYRVGARKVRLYHVMCECLLSSGWCALPFATCCVLERQPLLHAPSHCLLHPFPPPSVGPRLVCVNGFGVSCCGLS